MLDEWHPDAVAIERVFAQQNLRTVMGVAQASGVALHASAARGLEVGFHTPTEVKAAITGYGGAEKKQLATMVAKVLRPRGGTQAGRRIGCARAGDLSRLETRRERRNGPRDTHSRAAGVARRRALRGEVGSPP